MASRVFGVAFYRDGMSPWAQTALASASTERVAPFTFRLIAMHVSP